MQAKKFTNKVAGAAKHSPIGMAVPFFALSCTLPVTLLGAAVIGWSRFSVMLSTIDGLLYSAIFVTVLLAIGVTVIGGLAVRQGCTLLLEYDAASFPKLRKLACLGLGLGLLLGLAFLQGIVFTANKSLGALHAVPVSLLRPVVLGAVAFGLALALVAAMAALRGAVAKAGRGTGDIGKTSAFFKYAAATGIAVGVAACGVIGQCLIIFRDDALPEAILHIRHWAQGIVLLETACLLALLALGLWAATQLPTFTETRETLFAKRAVAHLWSALPVGLVGGGLVCALVYQVFLPYYNNQLPFYIPWGASAFCTLMCLCVSFWNQPENSAFKKIRSAFVPCREWARFFTALGNRVACD